MVDWKGDVMGRQIVAMVARHARFLLLLCAFLIAGRLFVSHIVSTVDSQTNHVHEKVLQDLLAGLSNTATSFDPIYPSSDPRTPRMRVTDAAGHAFYTPKIIGDPGAEYAVSRETLAQLNQDSSVPPLHLTRVLTSTDFRTYFRATATVEFEVYPWLNRTISVSAAVPVVRYAGATGYALSAIRAPQSYLPTDIARVAVDYVHGDGTTYTRLMTNRAGVDRLVGAINAISKYQPINYTKLPCPADMTQAMLRFSRQNGQVISGIVYSTPPESCGGIILSEDRYFAGAYPMLKGYVWPLLTKLVPPDPS
jgi:hypothetical protein